MPADQARIPERSVLVAEAFGCEPPPPEPLAWFKLVPYALAQTAMASDKENAVQSIARVRICVMYPFMKFVHCSSSLEGPGT